MIKNQHVFLRPGAVNVLITTKYLDDIKNVVIYLTQIKLEKEDGRNKQKN